MVAGYSRQPDFDQLPELREFAQSTVQLRYIDAVLEHGSNRAAAEALGMNRRTVDEAIIRVVKAAAKRGWSPDHDMTETVPDGFAVAGVSTLYRKGLDKDGAPTKNEVLQWVKSKQDAEKLLELAVEAIKEAFGDSTMKVPEIAMPSPANNKNKLLFNPDDLLIAYPMGDPHIGMYAWAEEAGHDFDVKIASRNLIAAMDRLVSASPEAKQAVIVNVGDFFHADTVANTSTRGTRMDVDTRWGNVLHVGVRAMRACIELALAKHEQVHVINEIGNHDEQTAQVLTLALSMAYEQNPRVTFDTSPGRFHYYRFGNVLLGVTHGDTVKPERLGEIMAADRQKEWGDTEFRYWYTGHIHTRKSYELRGCVVESFRSLAPKDAWTASMGYRSGRDMYSVTLHRKYGEIERHRRDIIMLD